MHFRATLDIYNKKNKFIQERTIYVRKDSITEVFDIIRKIRGARWVFISQIDLPTYIAAIEKQ